MRPDAARGQFEWRNFSVGVDADAAHRADGSAEDASVIRAEELKFTDAELREQEVIMGKIMKLTDEEYETMQA